MDEAGGTVTVLPSGARIEVHAGETLFEAAVRLGYSWPTRCFGQAQCTLCVLQLVAGDGVPPDAQETAVIRRVQSMQGHGRYRLACRMRVAGEVIVQKEGVRMTRV